MNKIRSKRGRPPVHISWPDVVFTAQDVVDSCLNKVSRVTIHSKLNTAVDSGVLKVVGQAKSPNGRPRVKYLKVSLNALGEHESPVSSCSPPAASDCEPKTEQW